MIWISSSLSFWTVVVLGLFELGTSPKNRISESLDDSEVDLLVGGIVLSRLFAVFGLRDCSMVAGNVGADACVEFSWAEAFSFKCLTLEAGKFIPTSADALDDGMHSKKLMRLFFRFTLNCSLIFRDGLRIRTAVVYSISWSRFWPLRLDLF